LPYPFDDNPFEKYFPELRMLRAEELAIYSYTLDKELPNKERVKWAVKCNKIKENIKLLIAKNQIPERSINLYLGEIELALEKLEKEFTKPEKPSKCSHSEKEIRLRFYTDKTSHIVTQCLLCGGFIKDHKKSEFCNWVDLPPYEEGKRRKEDIEYNRWWETRNEILKNIIGKDGRYPEFEYDEFKSIYEINNPKPMSSNECNHKLTQLTLRKYSESNTSVVKQCLSCGKHIDNIPKKSVKNINSFPIFDAGLEDEMEEKVNKWYLTFSTNLNLAKQSFEEELSRKIKAGEVSRVNKTTFGSYYESQEWARTREIILLRDDNTCQACRAAAECVHHITYDRLGRENDLDLMSLCNSCHNIVHNYQDKQWFGYRLAPIEIRSLICSKE